MPFSSLFFSAVEVGPFSLQLLHSLGVCLLLPKENLASPGHSNPKGHDTAVLILEVVSPGTPFLKVISPFKVSNLLSSSTSGHKSFLRMISASQTEGNF